MHVWIEHKTEFKVTLRMSAEESSALRQALLLASQHLVLDLEQHRLCNALASAMEEPECNCSCG